MWKDFFYFTKTERQGIIVLVVLIIGVFSIPRLVQLFSTPQEVTPEEDEKFKLEYDEFISSIKEIKPQRKFAEGDPPKNYSYSPKEVRLSIFDPNTADSITFISLGLPPWIAKNILRYRKKQGKFRHPEDFRKIYGLTDEQSADSPIINFPFANSFFSSPSVPVLRRRSIRKKEFPPVKYITSASPKTDCIVE